MEILNIITPPYEKDYNIVENIAADTDHLDGQANRRAIFKIFRNIDQSHLYPINGRFNATERAINRLRKFEKSYGQALYGLELCYWLENEIIDIVNS